MKICVTVLGTTNDYVLTCNFKRSKQELIDSTNFHMTFHYLNFILYTIELCNQFSTLKLKLVILFL